MTKPQILSFKEDDFTSFWDTGCVLQVLPTLIQIQNSLQLSSCLIYSPVKFSFKKAEEKNYLDEEHPAQDKTRFYLNEALSLGVPCVLLHNRVVTWAGNP